MSTPRYDWWSYVKGMIRRYPELCAKQTELRQTPLSIAMTGMPHQRGKTSDPVADAVMRELPSVNRRELEAVQKAIEETRALRNGAERLEMVRLVFWARTHTLEGAAMKLHWSERTVASWHREFIRCVAKYFGFFS
ncbi:hypothetical protein [uncultured Gemmiger sp.]|uniref:hypothetical protein n=1 Tax=uncultured Gemmiger sp. TaxID=1623490 RepID=UPI0025D5FBD0|nr:hypothetical protein [uncultured Gemmiger sp.]